MAGLPQSRRAEVEAWFAAHPDEAERAAAYRGLNEHLRLQYDPCWTSPCRSAWSARRGAARACARSAWRPAGLRWASPSARSPAGSCTPCRRRCPSRSPRPRSIARRAALAHATYSPEVRHPVEVGADQEQHLVAWLSKRLGGDVRAPKLDGEGMALVGGRLLPRRPRPVAQFMYQSAQGRRVTLYVRTEGPDQRRDGVPLRARRQRARVLLDRPQVRLRAVLGRPGPRRAAQARQRRLPPAQSLSRSCRLHAPVAGRMM